MQRIRPQGDAMKIEHWRCRERHPQDALRYRNLLGACRGNEGQPPSQQTCDTRKGNADLSRNPCEARHSVEAFVSYTGDGRIISRDGRFHQELNQVLNLNHPFLVSNRKAVLAGLHHALPRQGNLAGSVLQRMLHDWSTPADGQLRPFCGVVIYWLRKRLARS